MVAKKTADLIAPPSAIHREGPLQGGPFGGNSRIDAMKMVQAVSESYLSRIYFGRSRSSASPNVSREPSRSDDDVTGVGEHTLEGVDGAPPPVS